METNFNKPRPLNVFASTEDSRSRGALNNIGTDDIDIDHVEHNSERIFAVRGISTDFVVS